MKESKWVTGNNCVGGVGELVALSPVRESKPCVAAVPPKAEEVAMGAQVLVRLLARSVPLAALLQPATTS